jgi:hypothetical protein
MIDGRICFENGNVMEMDVAATIAQANLEWEKLQQRAIS